MSNETELAYFVLLILLLLIVAWLCPKSGCKRR